MYSLLSETRYTLGMSGFSFFRTPDPYGKYVLAITIIYDALLIAVPTSGTFRGALLFYVVVSFPDRDLPPVG